jgi:hypothetical protein
VLPPTEQPCPSLMQRPEKQQPLFLQEPAPQQGSPGPPQVLQTPDKQTAPVPHGLLPAQQGLPGMPQGLHTASTREAELHRVCGSWQTPPQHG